MPTTITKILDIEFVHLGDEGRLCPCERPGTNALMFITISQGGSLDEMVTPDIVANGNINVNYVRAYNIGSLVNTPEPLLLGGGINSQIQTAAGGVSYDHSLGAGYEAEPSFLFYHSLGDIDGSAFDNIILDAGAYDFIEDELKNFKGVVPSFFGTP